MSQQRGTAALPVALLMQLVPGQANECSSDFLSSGEGGTREDLNVTTKQGGRL